MRLGGQFSAGDNSGTEVANVGHARAAEGLLDLGASDFRQEPGVIRVVARNNLVGRFG